VTNNSEGVDALLDSPLIPCLLWTLESASSIAATSPIPNDDVVEIQKNICRCLFWCSFFSYEQNVRLVDYGVIPSLLRLLEKHVSMMKGEKRKMDELVIRHAAAALDNISIKGSNESLDGEKNKFRNVFDSVGGVGRLYEVFDYLHTQQNQSPDEKEAVQFISLCICHLFKSDTPPSSYIRLLVYLEEMKSSTPTTSGFDFPKEARLAWNRMIGADECLKKYK
jgi:hypothetical protein